MSLIDAVNEKLIAAQLLLADPVTGTPTAPSTTVQDQANTVWSALLWVGVVVGVLCLGAAGIMVGVSHQTGRPNDGLAKIGATLGGILVLFSAAGFVGGLTNT
jgi:hypothetical protein